MTAGVSQVLSPISHMAEEAGGVAAGYVAHVLVGGTVSAVSGGKFANGAMSASVEWAFNELNHRTQRASAKREAAKKRGIELTEPHLRNEWESGLGEPHDYPIGPTPLCNRGEPGCRESVVNEIIAPRTVPVNFSYTGEGRYDLPFDTGLDPIRHFAPQDGAWVNTTLEGHRYHPGGVVHVAYWSDDTYWLFSRGRGTGADGKQNTKIGVVLFGSDHGAVQNQVRREVLWRRVFGDD